MSSKFPTLPDCLRELGRRIEQDHGPTCVAAAQKLQAAEKDAADASTKRSHDEGAASLTLCETFVFLGGVHAVPLFHTPCKESW
jgi:hypothetical protein